MDDIDRAQAHSERMLALQLAQQVGKSQGQGASRARCIECDDPIPEERRVAIAGVTHCTSCSQWLAKHNKRR